MQVPMLASMKGDVEGTQGREPIYPWSSRPVSCPDRSCSSGPVFLFGVAAWLLIALTSAEDLHHDPPLSPGRPNPGFLSSGCLAHSDPPLPLSFSPQPCKPRFAVVLPIFHAFVPDFLYFQIRRPRKSFRDLPVRRTVPHREISISTSSAVCAPNADYSIRITLVDFTLPPSSPITCPAIERSER
jgi:hypothetical protein